MLSPQNCVVSEISDDLQCTICLDVPSSSTRVLQCINGHIFCEAPCMEQYLSHSKTYQCPICRVAIDPARPIRSLAAEHIIAALPTASALAQNAQANGKADATVCAGASLGCTWAAADESSRITHEAACPHAIAQRAVERERTAWRAALRRLEHRIEQLEAGGGPTAGQPPTTTTTTSAPIPTTTTTTTTTQSAQPPAPHYQQYANLRADGYDASRSEVYASTFVDSAAQDGNLEGRTISRVGGAARGHVGSVCAIAASSDWAISGSIDRTLRLWRRRHTSSSDGDGDEAAASGYLATEPAPLVEIGCTTEHTNVVCAVAVHPSIAHVAFSGSFDGTLRVWRVDATCGSLRCTARVDVGGKVLSLEAASRAQELYVGSARGEIFVFDVTGVDEGVVPQRIAAFEAHAGMDVRAIAMAESEHQRVIFTAGGDACVKAWRAGSNAAAPLATLTGHGNPVRALALAHHHQLLFSGASDATIRVWFVGGLTGAGAGEPSCLHILRGHKDTIWSLICDRYFLYSGSADATVRVWSIRQGAAMLEMPEMAAVLEGHQDVVWTIGQMPSCESDSRALLLSGSADCTVAAWAWD